MSCARVTHPHAARYQFRDGNTRVFFKGAQKPFPESLSGSKEATVMAPGLGVWSVLRPFGAGL